jgi:hypothetical protein
MVTARGGQSISRTSSIALAALRASACNSRMTRADPSRNWMRNCMVRVEPLAGLRVAGPQTTQSQCPVAAISSLTSNGQAPKWSPRLHLRFRLIGRAAGADRAVEAEARHSVSRLGASTMIALGLRRKEGSDAPSSCSIDGRSSDRARRRFLEPDRRRRPKCHEDLRRPMEGCQGRADNQRGGLASVPCLMSGAAI